MSLAALSFATPWLLVVLAALRHPRIQGLETEVPDLEDVGV